MSATYLIARRELAGYLRSWLGYLIIAGVLLIDGLIFNAAVLGGGEKRSSEALAQFFFWSSGLTVIAAVLISFRVIAEERQTGTINLLYSSPVRDVEIVLGKFLSALLFLAVLLACSLFMPALIKVHGKISLGHVAAGYLGLMLLGSATLAIGTFASSLTRSQVLAAILSGALTAAMALAWYVGKVTERPLSEVFTSLGLHGLHFQPFQSGVVHLRDVVYYLAVTYLSLFAASRVVEARRWR